jgi:aryl-alcohol dehydrogenase-like predicted oxidoreductase
MADEAFAHRDLPRVGKRVFRLGLSASYGMDERTAREALDGPFQYVFWPATANALTAPLRDACRRDRARYVVASGPTFGFLARSPRKRVEKALRVLATDYLDVLQLFWVGVGASLAPRMLDELVRLREEGKVRAIGVSIHDRPRAGRLAKDSPLDLLMIRYNAAHPGAEQDIFPHFAERRPAVVAYTATSWTRLLRRNRRWDGPPMTAGDCYRFCLNNPSVDVVLTAPGKAARLRENVAALERGPLSAEEEARFRAFGRAVHG